MGSMTPLSLVLGGVQALKTVMDVAGTVQSFDDMVQGEDRRREALRANQDLALKQLSEKQAFEQRQDAARAQLEARKAAQESAAQAAERQKALKRAVARRKAHFGASGTGSSGGSAQAVLLGLFDETDEERAEREKMDRLRTRALELGQSRTQGINMLQRSQLQERQALERAVRS